MKLLAHIVMSLAVLAACLTGCDTRPAAGTSFSVEVNVDSVLHRQCATLWTIDDDYQRLRCLGTDSVKDGEKFSFNGVLDCRQVAFIQFAADSIPFYFVLEPGTHTVINITPSHWRIDGSRACYSYIHFLNQRQHITDDMKKTWKAYRHMAADSTLKRRHEVMFFRHDSLLLDSLQRITVERINRGDLVSRIVRERFINTLDSSHLSQIRPHTPSPIIECP